MRTWNRTVLASGAGLLRRTALAVIVALLPLDALPTSRHYACTAAINMTTSAFLARDWPRMLASALEGERQCAAVALREGQAGQIGQQVIALNEMGRFQEAAQAADRCEQIHPMLACPLYKGKAMMAMGRLAEARTALAVASQRAVDEERRSAAALELGSTSQADADYYRAKIEEARSVLRLASESLATLPAEPGGARDPQGRNSTTGSGFVLNAQGDILTNQHVVDGCVGISAAAAGKESPAKLMVADAKFDLAVIRAAGSVAQAAQFRVDGAKLGEPITAVGFPLVGLLSTQGTVSFGNVSALMGVGNDLQKLQISAPVQPGNSGGPLLDAGGLVVGVIVQKLNALGVARVTGDVPQNVNFAIKSEIAQTFLTLSGIPYEKVPTRRSLEPTEVARVGQSMSVLITCSK